jgi:hypothetical protein
MRAAEQSSLLAAGTMRQRIQETLATDQTQLNANENQNQTQATIK